MIGCGIVHACQRISCRGGFLHSIHHVGSEVLTQIVVFGGTCLYLLSHLTGPLSLILPKNWLLLSACCLPECSRNDCATPCLWNPGKNTAVEFCDNYLWAGHLFYICKFIYLVCGCWCLLQLVCRSQMITWGRQQWLLPTHGLRELNSAVRLDSKHYQLSNLLYPVHVEPSKNRIKKFCCYMN